MKTPPGFRPVWLGLGALLLLVHPLCAQNAISFNFCKAVAMEPDEAAGAEVRVTHWNNLLDVKAKADTSLPTVQDQNGKMVADMTITVTGGSSANEINSLDWVESGVSEDAKLFNGTFDQDEHEPTTITVTKIPFAKYDVYFYRRDDNENADQRAGEFQIGEQTLFARGGQPNPDTTGGGYVPAKSTTAGNGTDIQQGNYVKFSGLSGETLNASFIAVFAGDDTQRTKVAGFQIVEASSK